MAGGVRGGGRGGGTARRRGARGGGLRGGGWVGEASVAGARLAWDSWAVIERQRSLVCPARPPPCPLPEYRARVRAAGPPVVADTRVTCRRWVFRVRRCRGGGWS